MTRVIGHAHFGRAVAVALTAVLFLSLSPAPAEAGVGSCTGTTSWRITREEAASIHYSWQITQHTTVVGGWQQQQRRLKTWWIKYMYRCNNGRDQYGKDESQDFQTRWCYHNNWGSYCDPPSGWQYWGKKFTTWYG